MKAIFLSLIVAGTATLCMLIIGLLSTLVFRTDLLKEMLFVLIATPMFEKLIIQLIDSEIDGELRKRK